jgi:hypothetical protein
MANQTTLRARHFELCRTRDYLLALHARGVHWTSSDRAELEVTQSELAALEKLLAQVQHQ